MSYPLTALDSLGAVRWTTADSGRGVGADTSMVLLVQTLYGTTSNTLRAIGKDGVEQWSLDIGTAKPAVVFGPGNTLIVSGPKLMRALNRSTGAELWRAATPYVSAPVSIINGNVYLASTYVHVFNAATGQLLGRTSASDGGSTIAPICTPAGLMQASTSKAYLRERCE